MPRKNPSAKSSALALSAVERVILYVKDAERSALWYQKTLGVPVRYKDQDWVELETKGVALCLHGGRKGRASGDRAHVAFRVEDFDGAYKALKLREVPGLGEPFSPCGGVRCLSFEDLDGNALGIEGS